MDTVADLYASAGRRRVQVITDGRFYSTRSLHQQAGSWIDDDGRLHISMELYVSLSIPRQSADHAGAPPVSSQVIADRGYRITEER